MSKLYLTPDNSSYSAERGKEVLSERLDGGASRYRRDILNAATLVDVVWILDEEGYTYLEAFFRATIKHGSLPFTIDLVIEDATVRTYTAYFVPTTKKLTSQKGLSYTVVAQLEVASLVEDSVADLAVVAAFESAHGG